jgi:hypothetical protein
MESADFTRLTLGSMTVDLYLLVVTYSLRWISTLAI